MATDFEPWLESLRRDDKLVENIPAATRGVKWEQPVEIEGDWTGATLAGSVRAAPDADTALAGFTITGPVVADGWSTFTASLAAGSGADSTGSLPADSDHDGIENFACMFRLTPDGGDEDVLFGGVLPVRGYV